jgi:hypothetical protein
VNFAQSILSGLISVPAVMAALLIASQVSGAGIFHSGPVHVAGE